MPPKESKSRRISRRKAKLRARYDITPEDYQELYDSQKGKCAICGKQSQPFVVDLFVDHSHTTKQIRGLLCRNCNLLLGFAKEGTEILEKAITYLNRSK